VEDFMDYLKEKLDPVAEKLTAICKDKKGEEAKGGVEESDSGGSNRRSCSKIRGQWGKKRGEETQSGGMMGGDKDRTRKWRYWRR